MEDSNEKRLLDLAKTLLKRRGARVGLVVFVLALMVGRVALDVHDSGETLSTDAIMNMVTVFVIVSLALLIAHVFNTYLAGYTADDYDPPLGKSPTMPGYYEEHYEGKDLRLNAFGELVPAGGPGDPTGRHTVERGAPQFYSAAAGAAEMALRMPLRGSQGRRPSQGRRKGRLHA